MTPAAATAAFLRQYDPDARQVAIRYSPLRRVPARDVLTNLTLAEAGADPASRDEPAISVVASARWRLRRRGRRAALPGRGR